MHIPDGYLGPATCGFFYAVMMPIWIISAKKVKKNLNEKQVPLLGIAAAFSFVIMMFNVPIPGGTTGHAVGGGLIAIILGPWAASIAITVALVIQALLFGDGGLTAIGANCFNMAFVLPFTSYYIYKILTLNSEKNSNRKIFAAGAAAYIGLNIAAFLTGIEFGLQPLLHHTSTGQPLYCPFGLKIAITAMAGEHLLIFGWIEGIITALAVKFLQLENSKISNTGSELI